MRPAAMLASPVPASLAHLPADAGSRMHFFSDVFGQELRRAFIRWGSLVEDAQICLIEPRALYQFALLEARAGGGIGALCFATQLLQTARSSDPTALIQVSTRWRSWLVVGSHFPSTS